MRCAIITKPPRDPRVPTVLSNYFHYMLVNLPARPLSDWGKARAGDEMDVALWLYNRNGDTNLVDARQSAASAGL